jgi:hypothetical protein
MAENPIRKEDIIDGAGIAQSIREIISLLQVELVGAMKAVSKEATDLKTALNGANTATKDGQEQTRMASEKSKELSETKKVLLKLERDLEKATAQYQALRTTEGKLLSDQIRKTKEATKALNDSRKEIKDAEGSYNALNKRLNELIKQYKAATAAQRDGLTPEIQKLDKELKKLDAGMGRHQRNVGNYASAMTALPGPLGRAASGVQQLGAAFKALLLNPVVLVISLIVGALAALGAAFKSTDKGGTELAARFEQIKAVIDVFRQRVVTLTKAIGHVFKGEWKEAGEAFKNTVSGAGEQLREATRAAYDYAYAIDAIEDAENNYVSQSAETRNAIAKLEFTAQDRSRSVTERKKALQDALALGEQELAAQREFARKRLEAEITYIAGKSNLAEQEVLAFIKMTDAEQENADEAVKTARNNNEKKFAELEQFYANWIDLDTKFYEENKRNISRMTGFDEQERKKIEEAKKAELDKSAERVKTYWDNETKIAEKATSDNTAIVWKGYDDEYKLQLAQVEQQTATEEEKQQKITEITQKYAWQRREIAKKEIGDALEIIGNGVSTIGDLYSAQKERELSAAGDNAKKREEIERKYFRKQQMLSIAQAVINGAQAVTKAQAQTGILSPFVIPLIIAQTIAQIALISAQKFAKGGFTGKGSRRDETGERVAGVVHENEFVIDKKKTKKYRPLLEAIHRDDKLAIASALNNSTVIWDKTAQVMNRQDPFTEKMYQLMQNTPVSYTDSSGATVLIYPGGRKKVIKRSSSLHYNPSMIR